MRRCRWMSMSKGDQSDIVALLSRASSYHDDTTSVDMIETHISWVFLTDRHAYKLKKGVCLEFLDFSTPELRRRACLRELSLNRRFAPGVYFDVLPITREPTGSVALAGSGQDIDWVVKMRRLPADKALDVILRKSRLTSGNADD